METPANPRPAPPESKCRQRLRQGLRDRLFRPVRPWLNQELVALPAPAGERPVQSQFTEMDEEHAAKVAAEPTLAWRPANAPSILEEVRTPVKLLLYQDLAPGDAVMLSAAVRPSGQLAMRT
jgi:hypothetical protein